MRRIPAWLGKVSAAALLLTAVGGGQTALATSGVVTAAAAASLPVTRLAGASRYDTNAAVLAQYPVGVPSVYVASGQNFPDALAASAAAGTQSPVALVQGGTVPSSVLAQIQRLHPGQVILVGGASVVPDSVGQTLGQYATDGWTRRAGTSRFGTAASLSASTFAPGVPVAYVAYGMNFPDALSASALGARNGSPVLLAETNVVPTDTANELARLKPARIVVVGGPSVVSDSVLNALKAYAPSVSRLYGASRFDTNVAAVKTLGPVSMIVSASGLNFPDALSGAAYAARNGGALLLVSSALASDQVSWLQQSGATSEDVVGGTSVVPSALADDIAVAGAGGSPTATSTPTQSPTSGSLGTPAGDPSANLSDRTLLESCGAVPASSTCLNAAVAAINQGRASEGITTRFVLPSNWSSLDAAEQLLVITNSERTVRGLPKIAGLVGTLDSAAATGSANNADPFLPGSTVDGHRIYGWGSNWAWNPGGPLFSDFEWMYNDGLGSGNVDCTSTDTAGCWGHRHNVLAFRAVPAGQTLTFGAAERLTTWSGMTADSDADILVLMDTTNGQPAYVYTGP